ncbi:type II toxin-antitoxin system RelE/ParE family toxin [Chryseobacterium sp. Ch-15]|uniref:Type II toxin-antitoxin system RelE/ParE family toxin n=1 Tax=Chryseobacterium muglaense TaxID=2893752 RepID=A0A9Q3YSP4_9FLAO|nr:type II toxin-antitoxin system RelE/ParE family toxin [Chryseobacterium muglaense]MBD3903192.1 type II toxin-antitoxin system RelE/ParE family toxin [Chryseobacterium muglaense]MCC9036024.1 type II toxin-antitoxin system RelE/ParE family toxin [Chryseobacterium muglaense]MCM2553400.1 type II toxin-antitoxin system RelE/ParE family toxin [Chryseobacterium muglaense]
MKSGYNISWTPNALTELRETIEYLQKNFSDKEISKLARKIESFSEIISQNPYIFPKSEQTNIHKAIILTFNTVYYRIKDNNVEILSFFSNRQSPIKRKI